MKYAEQETGVPADVIQRAAHAYARADRAEICWTLGITEHHNAVDNVLSLINLALLTGHVGQYGSGVNPLRGQNNVQGGGDMGAIPNRLVGLPGLDHGSGGPAKFEQAWGVTLEPKYGRNVTQMFEAHGARRDALRSTSSERTRRRPRPTRHRAEHLLKGLDHLVVQDIFLTRTARVGPRGAAGLLELV